MVNKFLVKLPKKGKTPPNCPKQPGLAEDAGSIVGRAVLAKLCSAKLYSLLQLKNVPDRSKVRAKEARLDVLEGTVTRADLDAIGVPIPAGTTPGPTPRPASGPVQRAGFGTRLAEPAGSTDVHAAILVAAVVTPDGHEVKRQFPNTVAGIRDLAGWFRAHGASHIAMESTAEYWLKPFWGLREAGLDVLVVNPVQSKGTQGSKTDWKDAVRLAYALRDGRLKRSVTCTPEQYARRKLARDATKKVQQGAKALSRLNAMFCMFDAPEWIQALPSSQRGLRVLARCVELGTLDEVGEVLAEEFASGKGKVTDQAALLRMSADVVVFLYRAGKGPGNRARLAHHLEEYVACRRMAGELRSELLQQASTDARFREDLELLLSLPDVGVDTALVLAVELVDARFFWRAKSAAKWAGLAPRVNQSGYKKRSTGHLFKGGNQWVRRACWLVAKGSFAHAGEAGHPFGEMVARYYHGGKKAYKVAVTAVARRVLTYAYHVLSERRPFAEVWNELTSEEAETNRQRKLKDLQKRMKQASTADLLPAVASALRRQCDVLEAVDARYAAEINAIPGAAVKAESA